jgi:glutamyl-tRNA reductase
MSIACVSLSHLQAPMHIIDQLGRAAEAWAKEPGRPPVVLLSTCHRVEIYVDLREGDREGMRHEASLCQGHLRLGSGDHEALGLGDSRDMDLRERPDDTLRGRLGAAALDGVPLHMLQGGEAVRHAIEVAAGLRSAALGEREIAGQVQRARAAARQAGTLSPRLDRFFHHVAKAQRLVRAELPMSGRVSLIDRALAVASPTGRRVLVIGTGRYAARTVAAVREHHPRSVEVFSGSGRAEEFASHYSGVTAATGGSEAAIARAEVVICCSGTGPIVTTQTIPKGHRVLVVDLARPSDVADGVATMDGVRLVGLDDLAAPKLGPVPPPPSALATATRLAEEFLAKERELAFGPQITAMRLQALAAAEAAWAGDVDRIRRRHGEAAAVDLQRTVRRAARAALHEPTVRMRARAHAHHPLLLP